MCSSKVGIRFSHTSGVAWHWGDVLPFYIQIGSEVMRIVGFQWKTRSFKSQPTQDPVTTIGKQNLTRIQWMILALPMNTLYHSTWYMLSPVTTNVEIINSRIGVK